MVTLRHCEIYLPDENRCSEIWTRCELLGSSKLNTKFLLCTDSTILWHRSSHPATHDSHDFTLEALQDSILHARVFLA